MMAGSQDHHLVEVLCAIWFDPAKNDWDSTYFGRYYELIEKRGYTQKEEQRAVRVRMNFKPKEGIDQPEAEMSEGDTRMIFRNISKQSAVILGSNYISFHKLTPYISWENLMDDIVRPLLSDYHQLGLGNELVQVQALYLNRLNLHQKESISKYFNFVPPVEDFGTGVEQSLNLQFQYELEPNLRMIISLTSDSDVKGESEDKVIHFNCSCFATRTDDNADFESLAAQAHDVANDVFIKITKRNNYDAPNVSV